MTLTIVASIKAVGFILVVALMARQAIAVIVFSMLLAWCGSVLVVFI